MTFDQESNFILPIYPKNFRAVKFLNNELICLVGEILRQKSNWVGAEKAIVMVREASTTEEKPLLLGWNNRNVLLRAKLQLLSRFCENPNLIEGRDHQLRT